MLTCFPETTKEEAAALEESCEENLSYFLECDTPECFEAAEEAYACLGASDCRGMAPCSAEWDELDNVCNSVG